MSEGICARCGRASQLFGAPLCWICYEEDAALAARSKSDVDAKLEKLAELAERQDLAKNMDVSVSKADALVMDMLTLLNCRSAEIDRLKHELTTHQACAEALAVSIEEQTCSVCDGTGVEAGSRCRKCGGARRPKSIGVALQAYRAVCPKPTKGTN